MKRYILCIVCMVLCVHVFAQEGVRFETLSLQEALVKAKKEKKLVFVDCYTTWCGPCKTMVEKVFPNKRVGDVLNKGCVPVKYDMETEEGKIIANKYGVKVFPTYLILKPDGTLQHKAVGAVWEDDFLMRLGRWLHPRKSRNYLERRYVAGKANTREKMLYLLALRDRYDKEESAQLEKELEGELKDKDKLCTAYWELHQDVRYGDESFRFLVDHRHVYQKLLGDTIVNKFLKRKYSSVVSNLIIGSTIENKNDREAKIEMAGLIEKELSMFAFEDSVKLFAEIRLAKAGLGSDMQEVIDVLKTVEPDERYGEGFIQAMGVRMVMQRGTDENKRQLLAMKDHLLGDGNSTYPLKYLLKEIEKELLEGVHFVDLSFEKALMKAKEENKLLFVDCYTSWCGPCKDMAKNVLPTKELGDLLNPVCVCIKCDMDNAKVKEVLGKYNIKAFPTFLIITPDGELQHKVVGSSCVEEFVEILKPGLQRNTSMAYLKELYDAGKCSKENLFAYWNVLRGMGEKKLITQVGEELFTMLTDEERVQPRYWPLLASEPVRDSPFFCFVLDHLNELKMNVEGERVNEFVCGVYVREIQGFLDCLRKGSSSEEKKMMEILAQVKQEVDVHAIEGKEKLLPNIEWIETCLNKEVKVIVTYLKDISVTDDNLNIVNTLYSVVERIGNETDLNELVALKESLDKISLDKQAALFKAIFGGE